MFAVRQPSPHMNFAQASSRVGDRLLRDNDEGEANVDNRSWKLCLGF